MYTSEFIIITLVLVSILMSSIWNIFKLNQIKKLGHDQNNSIKDEKYFDLKYRLQYHTTIFSVVIIVVAFFGYRSYSDIQDSISKPINENIKDLSAKLTKYDSIISGFENNMDTLRNTKNELLSALNSSISDYNSLESDFKLLKESLSRELKFYVVKGIKYDPEHREESPQKDTKLFENLFSINGNPLPKFRDPPILVVFNTNGSVYNIIKVTNEGFEVHFIIGAPGSNNLPEVFDLLIITT